MRGTIAAVLVCSMVAVSSGALCTPDQWEGLQFSVAGIAVSQIHDVYESAAEMSYDAINNRTYYLVNFTINGVAGRSKIITRYDRGSVGQQYVLDLITNQCNITNVTTPFERFCVPANATRVGTFYLGQRPGAFNVTKYNYRDQDLRISRSVQEVGNNTFVLVSEAEYGSLEFLDFVGAAEFTNFSPGIRNTSVFDIPEQCRRPDKTSVPEEHTHNKDNTPFKELITRAYFRRMNPFSTKS